MGRLELPQRLMIAREGKMEELREIIDTGCEPSTHHRYWFASFAFHLCMYSLHFSLFMYQLHAFLMHRLHFSIVYSVHFSIV